jgi:putative PIN family toxin of toxin-antitoxin system
MMTARIVVWDSSVLIPLILPQSKSYHLYKRLNSAGWVIAANAAILGEVREKLETKETLRRWLGLDESTIEEFVQQILPGLVRVYPGIVSISGAVLADPEDDHVIAAVVESNADYILTEDKHLLDLRIYQSTAIMTRDEFALELDRLGVPPI